MDYIVYGNGTVYGLKWHNKHSRKLQTYDFGIDCEMTEMRGQDVSKDNSEMRFQKMRSMTRRKDVRYVNANVLCWMRDRSR